MRIGVIGCGNVGGTLGSRWAKAGHVVRFGVRDPAKEEHKLLLRKAGPNASIVSVGDAADKSEVVILSLPYPALADTVRKLPTGERIIIDCTNPITPDFSGVYCAGGSAAEEIAALTGSTRVVKCFNTVGFNIMEDPNLKGRPASMLYCGDDAGAKAVAAQLANDLGFAPEDAGPLIQARWLEGLAWLWISMAVIYGHERDMAFCLETR